MTPVIQGVGTSHFGKQPGTDVHSLAAEAVLEAFDDAGLDPTADEVDAVWVGTVFGSPGIAQRALHAIGVTGVPVITVENACASGTTALHESAEAVRSGRYGRVLALGLESMTAMFSGAIHPEGTDAEGASGMALPSLYAMSASRYLHEGLVTHEQLAAVSVKNHRHALANPRAQYSGSYSIEEVLDSPMIADPLTLLQCCPISDGAAAAVIGGDRGVATDVAVRASAIRSGHLWDQGSANPWGFDLVAETAALAFEAAGIGPEDVDVVEVHDAFTIGEVVTIEALGLVPRGRGGAAAVDGETAVGGRIPVNPSGGLLSRGHPLGSTGLAQTAEIVWQLRAQAADRQVEGARIGLVETMGGGVSGIDGNGCVIAVLGA